MTKSALETIDMWIEEALTEDIEDLEDLEDELGGTDDGSDPSEAPPKRGFGLLWERLRASGPSHGPRGWGR